MINRLCSLYGVSNVLTEWLVVCCCSVFDKSRLQISPNIVCPCLDFNACLQSLKGMSVFVYNPWIWYPCLFTVSEGNARVCLQSMKGIPVVVQNLWNKFPCFLQFMKEIPVFVYDPLMKCPCLFPISLGEYPCWFTFAIENYNVCLQSLNEMPMFVYSLEGNTHVCLNSIKGIPVFVYNPSRELHCLFTIHEWNARVCLLSL
jgi:hypothetical protein